MREVPATLQPCLQGNGKGTTFSTPPHNDDCNDNLTSSHDECASLPKAWMTAPIEENYVAELTLPCDQPIGISNESAAPCDIVTLVADLSAHIDLNANHDKSNKEIPAVLGEVCDMNEFDVGCVELITHGEFDKDLLVNSLCYITLDRPMHLSRAMDKIYELRKLKTFASMDAPEYKVKLIGEYGANAEFLVHNICITCENLAILKLAGLNCSSVACRD